MSQSTLPRTCRLKPAGPGRSLKTIMTEDTDYAKDVRDLKPWDEADFGLPGDKTLGETLMQIGKNDPTADDDLYVRGLKMAIRDRQYDPSCKWSRANLDSGVHQILKTTFADMNFAPVLQHLTMMTKSSPNTLFHSAIHKVGLGKQYMSGLVSTEDGEVGIVRDIQDTCHAPNCTDPTLRENQIIVLDNDGNWIHASTTDYHVSADPVNRCPSSCAAPTCDFDFKKHRLALVSVFGSLVTHLFDHEGDSFICGGSRMEKAKAELEAEDRAAREAEGP
jgi:hypothetical protein